MRVAMRVMPWVRISVSGLSCLLVFVLAPFSAHAFASEPAGAQPAGTSADYSLCHLVAGYDPAPPFHFRNDTGAVVGADADLLRQVAESIGCQVEFVERPWSRTLAGVKSGTVDIAIGASFKELRALWGYYSVPYKFVTHDLYMRAGEQNGVDSLADFFAQGQRLGVVIGWSYPIKVRGLLEREEYQDQIEQVGAFSQLPKMLQAGRVDGVIAIPEMIEEGDLGGASPEVFVRTARFYEELHFIFSKKTVTPGVIADFNNALYHSIYSGERNRLFYRYGLTP